MDYDLFWTLTPNELTPFNKAFMISNDLKDVQNWQLGLYVQQAVGSVMSKEIKYPEEPFSYVVRVEEDQRLKYIKNKENNRRIRDKILQRMAYINPKLEKANDEGGE